MVKKSKILAYPYHPSFSVFTCAILNLQSIFGIGPHRAWPNKLKVGVFCQSLKVAHDGCQYLFCVVQDALINL